MADPKLSIAANQNYGCIQCGRCCRRFHVAITAAETKRLEAMFKSWDDPDAANFVRRINGQDYFARHSDGGCVFLDEQDMCRMHGRFGYERKALTCRGYPLNIVSTFQGEVSAIARMDCPAVRQNVGKPLSDRRSEIRGMVRELNIRGGFSHENLNGLTRDAVVLVVNNLVRMLETESGLSPGDRAASFHRLIERFAKIQGFLNDEPSVREMLPTLISKAREEGSQRPKKRLGPFGRAVFREWLATYCRRDTEEVYPGWAFRLGRTLELGKFLFGFGNFRKLGCEHPDGSIHGMIFRQPGAEASEQIWELWRRWMTSRLRSFQFFGPAYYQQDFFHGLRVLATTYPLTLGAANLHAGLRGATVLEAEDIDYAVGAIDHTLGRSPLLSLPFWRRLETYFFNNTPALQLSLGWE